MPWVHLFDAVGVRRHVDEVRRSFASRPSPERRRRPRPAIPAAPALTRPLTPLRHVPPRLPSPSPSPRRCGRVHAICFPEERPEDDETDAAFWDRVTSFHDQDAVEWFLLFDETTASRSPLFPPSPPPSSSSSSPPPPPSPRLLGAIRRRDAYADACTAACSLRSSPREACCGPRPVAPLALSDLAASAGVFAIRATVDVAGSARLVRYSSGAARGYATGAGSAGSATDVVRTRCVPRGGRGGGAPAGRVGSRREESVLRRSRKRGARRVPRRSWLGPSTSSRATTAGRTCTRNSRRPRLRFVWWSSSPP